jgi:hypothetical protein
VVCFVVTVFISPPEGEIMLFTSHGHGRVTSPDPTIINVDPPGSNLS